MPPLDLYKEVHLYIISIGKTGFNDDLTTLSQGKGKIIPGDCFEEPVGWDL